MRNIHGLDNGGLTLRAPEAAAAGIGSTLMWQWLPPDLRSVMYRSNATSSWPCGHRVAVRPPYGGNMTLPWSSCYKRTRIPDVVNEVP